MIKIFPFKALTPKSEEASKIASQPYDVINAEEARKAAEGNPKSFLHVVRSEIDLPVDTGSYDQVVYETAAKNLESMIQSGLLNEDDASHVYVYRLTFKGRTQTGVVACCDAAQYRSDEIKKHEKTRPDKEDDRTKHMTVCSAHAEPVFLTFRDSETVNALLLKDTQQAPLIDFVAEDDVRHEVWRSENAEAYVAGFAEIDSVYIADGHHRTAGGERAATERQKANPDHTGDEEYNRILAVLFPSSQLQIMAYNRVVKDLNGMSEDDFLNKLKKVGDVIPTENPVPMQAGTVCVRTKNGWYQIDFPKDSIDGNDPINSLDVALLQSRILEPILGVGDPRTDARIGFVGGIRGTDELEQRVLSGDVAVAFSMFPTSIEQLLQVSDADEIMPPKSTWFEPKLRSGLFVHRFERF